MASQLALVEATKERAHARLHPLAWGCWLVCGTLMVFLTSNPLYALTIALAGLLVYVFNREGERRALDYLLGVGALVVVLSLPLNLLTGSAGDTGLVTLPSLTSPRWLGGVTFGGIITAESLVYAITKAADLLALLALVSAFNASVDHFRLLKHAPAALAQLGIVVSVGVMLIPTTLVRAATLREARTVRGYKGGGPSAFLALSVALLSDALERSVQRAESLDARGFGRLAVRQRAYESLAAVAALATSTIAAFTYYYAGTKVVPVLLMTAGAAALVAILFRQGSRSTAVRLDRSSFSRSDLVTIIGSVFAATVFIFLRVVGSGDLGYLPFPHLAAPSFATLPVLACLLLLAPAVLTAAGEARR